MSEDERPRVVLVNRCFVVSGEGKHLLVKRSADDRNNPGLWEIPGGKVDVGQELKDALEREVMEETGYLVESYERAVHVQSRLIVDGKYAGMPYVVLFHLTRIVGGKLKLSHEHSDAKWVTYDEMGDMELTMEVRKAMIVLEKSLRA